MIRSLFRSAGAAVGAMLGGFEAGRTMAMAEGRDGFAGGRRDRRTDDWSPGNAGPNAIADMTLEQMRNRCRDLANNHPQMAGAVKTIVDAVVGKAGIQVRPMTEWTDLNEQIRNLQRDNCTRVDPGREKTERQFQSELIQELIVSGELLIRFGVAPEWRDHPAGPCMEGIVSERLDLGMNEKRGENTIRQGVEIDRLGRVVAYHVYPFHPNDGLFFAGLAAGRASEAVRLDAAKCSMAKLTRRCGQIRGIPLAASVVHELKFGERVKDAALMQMLVQACFGVAVIGSNVHNKLEIGVDSTMLDLEGNPYRKLEPGMIAHVPAGKEVKPFATNLQGPGLDKVASVIDRRSARGMGLDYSAYSGDYSQATFSSIRASELIVHRAYRALQQLVFEVQALPWYQADLAWKIAEGRIVLTEEQAAAWRDPWRRGKLLRCRPQFAGFAWVNPQQQAAAAATSIAAGIMSIPDAIADLGEDPDETRDEILDWELAVKQGREARGLSSPSASSPPVSEPPPRDPDREDELDDSEDEDEDVRAGGRLARLNGHKNGVKGHA